MPRVLPKAARFSVIVLALLDGRTLVMSVEQTKPALTGPEQRDGWKLLFDGQSLTGWRGFKTESAPAGWTPVDGSCSVRVREATS